MQLCATNSRGYVSAGADDSRVRSDLVSERCPYAVRSRERKPLVLRRLPSPPRVRACPSRRHSMDSAATRRDAARTQRPSRRAGRPDTARRLPNASRARDPRWRRRTHRDHRRPQSSGMGRANRWSVPGSCRSPLRIPLPTRRLAVEALRSRKHDDELIDAAAAARMGSVSDNKLASRNLTACTRSNVETDGGGSHLGEDALLFDAGRPSDWSCAGLASPSVEGFASMHAGGGAAGRGDDARIAVSLRVGVRSNIEDGRSNHARAESRGRVELWLIGRRRETFEWRRDPSSCFRRARRGAGLEEPHECALFEMGEARDENAARVHAAAGGAFAALCEMGSRAHRP